MDNNMDWLSDFLDDSIPLWRDDPVMFFREVLNFEPDEWQAEAAEDLAHSPKVSIKSGQGVGKTGLEAAVFLWFITCFPYPRIVATAPTKQQLHDVLWSEISKWMSNSPLLSRLLKWTKTYVYMIGNEKRWFGVARTATKPENMQGFHEDNMLFIVDEASGVADPIMEAILGTLSGENNKLLMCGNPTKTSGTFYDSHTRDRALYKCHTVSSADSKRTNKENIESLEDNHAKIHYFSPLKDEHLPDVDALYIGGGYPELFSKELSSNSSMLKDIKKFHEDNRPLFAECGGLMYLMNSIHDDKMVSAYPYKSILTDRVQALKYTIAEVQEDNIISKKGEKFNGHEFHYSKVLVDKNNLKNKFAFKILRGRGSFENQDGFIEGNTLASYVHTHVAAMPNFGGNLTISAREL